MRFIDFAMISMDLDDLGAWIPNGLKRGPAPPIETFAAFQLLAIVDSLMLAGWLAGWLTERKMGAGWLLFAGM